MDSDVVGLGRYWVALKRRLWIVVVAVIVCAAALGGYVVGHSPSYDATADVLISPYSSGTGTEPAFTTGQVDTQVAVMQSLAVVGPVDARLHLGESPVTLQKTISAAAVGDTSVIAVTVSRGNAAEAAQVANALARQYVRFRNSAAPVDTPGTFARIVGAASPPPHRSGPAWWLAVLIGAVIGLVIGCVIALLVDRRDRSLKDEAATAEATGGLAVLGRIPAIRRHTKEPAIAADRASRQAIAYRFLAAAVRLRRPTAGPTVALVVSAAPRDGRTSVAANLSLAAADAGERVVLIDADLGQPTLTKLWDLDRDITLETLTQRTLPIGLDLLARPAPHLHAVGVASPSPGAAQFFGRGTLREVIGRLPESVDLIVLDTAPLLSAAEVLALVPQVDVVLLVVRERVSKEPDVTATLDLFRQVGGTVTGIVVTGSSAPTGTQRTPRSPRTPRRRPRPAGTAPTTPKQDKKSRPKALKS